MINTFNTKFKILESFKEKIPGIANGLEILKKLNDKISEVKTSDEVYYYNYNDKTVTGYSLVFLNTKLFDIYNEKINKEIIFNNRLYWILCDAYDKSYEKYKYPYYNGIFNKYDVINKFLQGLRRNKTTNLLKFEVYKVMKVFNMSYFDDTVSPQEFYLFMIDFISTLSCEKVLKYLQDDHSIEFDVNFEIDLNILIYTSFNLMVLGENGIYSSYDFLDSDLELSLIKMEELYKSCGQETKLFINSLTTSIVISSSVNKICAEENVNNIFIESIRKTI